MAFNSNGQISYLILDSLNHGSKYGLEIIEYISKKTNDGFIMKKPTLYSCLTRMEKKGLVSSSFWGESELGGKRHYYSITDEGKQALSDLSSEFENAQVSQNETKQTVVSPAEPIVEEKSEKDASTESPTFLEQSNLFDMVEPQTKTITVDEEDDEDSPLENQINFFDLPPVQESDQVQSPVFDAQTNVFETAEEEEKPSEERIEETQKDDGVFLDETDRIEISEDQEEQNKRIFDSSTEFKKLRRRKSFSENQIEMSVVYESEEDEQIQKDRIAEFKKSLLNLKNGIEEDDSEQQEEIEEETEITPYIPQQNTFVAPQVQSTPKTSTDEKDEKDDGIFITARMSATEVPVQRKIAPPNIDVFKDNLPAPKRNSELEPTYKDMMAKIFERKKEKEEEKIEEAPVKDTVSQTISDYSSLKSYYNSQGIEFKEYQKSPVKKTHNTNLLKFIISICLFSISALSSALMFWILSASNHLNSATNFMFYTIPLLFLCYSIVTFIIYKTRESKKAVIAYTAGANWIIFALASIVVLIVNVICGLQFESFGKFLTSFLLPVISFAIIFPINFYIEKFVYERFSK